MGYIQYRNGAIHAVYCKRGDCGLALILNVDGRLCPTTEYAEIVMLMADADGVFTNHESQVCKACQAEIEQMTGQTQQETLEQVYAADVQQWEEEAHLRGTPDAETRDWLVEMATRRVVRLLPEHGRGEAALG